MPAEFVLIPDLADEEMVWMPAELIIMLEAFVLAAVETVYIPAEFVLMPEFAAEEMVWMPAELTMMLEALDEILEENVLTVDMFVEIPAELVLMPFVFVLMFIIFDFISLEFA